MKTPEITMLLAIQRPIHDVQLKKIVPTFLVGDVLSCSNVRIHVSSPR
jgi:hypothetical protein